MGKRGDENYADGTLFGESNNRIQKWDAQSQKYTFHKVAFYFLYNISEEMMLQQMLKCQELFWLKVKLTTTNQINVNKTIVPTGIQDLYDKCPFESSF